MLDKKGVGKRIAYYRKEHGMTQKDLAALLNISYQAVSAYSAKTEHSLRMSGALFR